MDTGTSDYKGLSDINAGAPEKAHTFRFIGHLQQAPSFLSYKKSWKQKLANGHLLEINRNRCVC